MKDVYVLAPGKTSPLLKDMIDSATKGYNKIIINDSSFLPDLKNKRILFAIELNMAGYNLEYLKMMTSLHERGEDSLLGSVGGVLIHGDSELYTKSIAQDVIFQSNLLGCSFPGRPIVEATASLSNLLTIQKAIKKPIDDVLSDLCYNLGKTIMKHTKIKRKNPKLLVLHASNRETSNTLNLWDMIKIHIKNVDIKEIHIENGTVRDCKGCPYKTCKHYGEQTSCFYGGIMVEEVYPAVLEADSIVWICPNYNDALSANMSAVINRLTALFRKTKFYDKSIFGVIVSGNSGSDILSKQLISALNINKTFRLPPYFSIMATANDKDAIYEIDDIRERAKSFGVNITNELNS